MYKKTKPSKGNIQVNESFRGETIEQKVRKIVNNKEPITDGAPLVYTERKDGVQPQYNIRTDRFEIAIDAMDKVSATYKARREEKPTIGEQAKDGMKKEDTGGKPAQATDNK